MARFSESAARLAGLAGALLGWRPEEFWSATPAELGAVLGAMAGTGDPGVSSDDLGRLMERFPDQGCADRGGDGPLAGTVW